MKYYLVLLFMFIFPYLHSETIWFQNVGSCDKTSYDIEIHKSDNGDSIRHSEQTLFKFRRPRHRFIVDSITFDSIKEYIINFQPKLVTDTYIDYCDFGTHLITLDYDNYQLQKTLYCQADDGVSFFRDLRRLVKIYPRLDSELRSHTYQSLCSDFHPPLTPCYPSTEKKQTDIRCTILKNRDSTNPYFDNFAIVPTLDADSIGVVDVIEDSLYLPWRPCKIFKVDLSTFETLKNSIIEYPAENYNAYYNNSFLRIEVDYRNYKITKCFTGNKSNDLIKRLLENSENYPQLKDIIKKWILQWKVVI